MKTERERSIDKHVGARIRQRRHVTGLTQQRLGELSGVKFQQIQKYESGGNRVSASRLKLLGDAMDVPVSYFFKGLEGEGPADPGEPINKRTGRLVRDFEALPEHQKRAVENLLDALNQAETAAG